MSHLPSHVLNKFYNEYGEREIAFNQSIIKYTGLEPKKIFLKIGGEYWHCVLYSCSMKSAKVIVNFDQKAFELLKKYKNMVHIRLSFLPDEYKNSIVFFVQGYVRGYKNFSENPKNLYLLTVDFYHRPPDDLIEILGSIIKEWEEFEKREDIRIPLEKKSLEYFGFSSNKSFCEIDMIKRPCIIKNISAGGALIILSCIPKFIMNKNIKLFFFFKDKRQILILEGNIIRYEEIQGRKDIYAIGIKFLKEKIPIEYKKLINSFLNMLNQIDLMKK